MPDDQEVTYDPLIELMKRFENVKQADSSADPFAGLSKDDRLKKHIVDGIKKNLEAHLDDSLKTKSPLDIINEVLLDGMKTVGELFGAGKMQLPFVLQSAEVMKAAVRYLEPLMEKEEGSEKGSILLATVAGDVHDIGKNLVDIILTNNGYRVVNIGIKQPINNIINQAQEHKVQVIGLSGLLVKSTLVMRDNLLELNQRGLSGYPVILGGAALTRSYVEHDLREIYEGQVFYAQDAFEGLRLMAEIGSGEPIELPTASLAADRVQSHRLPDRDPELYVFDGTRSDVEILDSIPDIPFYGAQKCEAIDIEEVYGFINPVALFRGQWQFRKPEGMANPEFSDWLDETATPIFERKKQELSQILKPAVKWGYFYAQSEGNDLIVYEEDGRTERARFTFPRQRDGKRLCLSDFFLPVKSGRLDVVGFSIVTVGPDISEYERAQFAAGDYQDYLFTHGMGVESAEALAELWHKRMRSELGIDAADPEDKRLLFSAKYQGSRYSFGYPACPNLEDQATLFELLEPGDIGVQLSEEFMLEPEQSTSAIVVHHPAAKYFVVR